MKVFKIFLKNEKINTYQRLGYFLLTIFILLYIFLAFFTNNSLNTTNKVIILYFPVIYFIIRIFFPGRIDRTWIGHSLVVLALGFVFLQSYWLTAACFIPGILLQYAIKEKVALFNNSHITYPSFPARKIIWSELTNCILKDTILTIDFKNNKVIQQMIDQRSEGVNEKEFNDFCKQQLAAASAST